MNKISSHVLFLMNIVSVAVILTATAPDLSAMEYRVSTNSNHKSLEQIPWETLQPGDIVTIPWRPQPYRSKWVLCRRGMFEKPITVRGIPGPKGQLPIIDGQNALTRATLDFWSEDRGVIKIGGSTSPADTMPAFIVIENLDIRNARPAFNYNGRNTNQPYSKHAAAIFVEKGENITIRNCILHNCSNGLFVAHESSNILVENCRLFNNGIEGSYYQHNSYTEASGITFQYNLFGPLRYGCTGNNLKDRSAGLIVRYNWIEGGNRQLDLVEPDEGKHLLQDPRFHETFVYGNVLIEPDRDGNNQIVHYGGDSGEVETYRQGTLYFYNNTVISKRTDTTTLFKLSTNNEKLDCRNNIFYSTANGQYLAILDDAGTAQLNNNWLKKGWRGSHEIFAEPRVHHNNTLTGDLPQFVDFTKQDYRIRGNSPCVDAGTALSNRAPALENLVQPSEDSASTGSPKLIPWQEPLDLGAFEFNPQP